MSRTRRDPRGADGADGPNHHLWVVSYADMVTLLFAVFVVFYSMSEVKRKSLQELRRSIVFAFGGGGYEEERGMFEEGAKRGELLDAFELINAQPGPMKQFLLDTLPEKFQEVTGSSLEISITDDTLAFTATLDAFYAPGEDYPRPGVEDWLRQLLDGVGDLADRTIVEIEAPDVIVALRGDGTALGPQELCHARLARIHDYLAPIQQIDRLRVESRFTFVTWSGPPDEWERGGSIRFAFRSE